MSLENLKEEKRKLLQRIERQRKSVKQTEDARHEAKEQKLEKVAASLEFRHKRQLDALAVSESALGEIDAVLAKADAAQGDLLRGSGDKPQDRKKPAQ